MNPYISFSYDKTGRGDLVVYNNNQKAISSKARTGSIDTTGTLVNAIKHGVWYIRQSSVDTLETAMIVPPEEVGWKIRLFNGAREFTHYLIHPDGGKPGSLGCIVTPDMAPLLRAYIDELLKENIEIPVFINEVTENEKTSA